MWLLFFILMYGNAIAGQVNVVTQFGYLTDSNGHIVGKCNYNKGVVQIRDDYTYTELPDQKSLDAITIYTPPVSPLDAFSVDKFVEDLLGAFGSDVNVLPYYAAFKDLASYKNFSAMKSMVQGLLTSGKLTQAEVDSLNSVLANQGIVLSNF